MKTYKILLFLVSSLLVNEVKGQSGLLKPLLKKGAKEVTSEAIEYSAKKGAKEITNEAIEYSTKKGIKEFAEFSTKKSPKELLKIIEINSKNGMTRNFGTESVKVKGKTGVLKLLKKSNQELTKKGLKTVVRLDLITYATKRGFRLVPNKRSVSLFNREGVHLGKIYQNGKKSVIVAPEVITNNSSKLKYIVNPILDDPLPNSIYKVGNTTFKTDNYSRTVLAKIKSIAKSVLNRGDIKKGGFKRSKNWGVLGDHDGHLIAHSLGGNYGSVNLVAQLGTLNTRKYAAVENFIRKNNGLIKNYQIKPSYVGESLRPNKISQLFEFRGGVDELMVLKKGNPSLKFTKNVDVYGKEVYNCIITHSNLLM